MSRIRSFFDSWGTPLLCAALAFGFSQTVAGLVSIPSESMQPTLNPGDILVVNRVAYGLHVPFTTSHELTRWAVPQPGDIVIFNVPEAGAKAESLFIKRVVAKEGDVVAVQLDHLTVNGKPVSYEPLPVAEGPGELEQLGPVRHHVLTGPGPLQNFGPFTVPAGHIFVMGDHRNDSLDSRAWGPVPLERVRGKAVYRLHGTQGQHAGGLY